MPSSPQIFYDMSTSHLVGELRELLVEGLEFSNLGLVKREAGFPVPYFDSLLTRLEESTQATGMYMHLPSNT